jgi:hypothetical protein
MAKFQLGDVEFPRKADAVAHVNEVRKTWPLGVPVEDPLVYAALDLHRDRDEKIGPGLAHIEVGINEYRERCFYAVRVDGTRVDFSYRMCFGPATPWADLTVALRCEIMPQIYAFRDATPLVCALSGIPLTLGNLHVDHVPPATFSALAREWVDAQGGVQAVPSHKAGTGVRALSDEVQAKDWRRFHEERAQLRLLSIEAHALVTHGGTQTIQVT